jgi:hypothetical protein
MNRNFPEELGEWLSHKNPTQRDRNLVAFLAVLDDVKAALKTGYAAKSVWGYLRESKRIEFGYDTFLNYVNRFIGSEQSDRAAAQSQAASKPLAPDNRKSTVGGDNPTTKTLAKEPGFTFNPVPNKEELF